jgi:hypothetical protein
MEKGAIELKPAAAPVGLRAETRDVRGLSRGNGGNGENQEEDPQSMEKP